MATAAFRSDSRRSSIGGDECTGSSTRLRRSRSLSRCSGVFPPPSPEIDQSETPRGKFVNKARGSGFLEISLDDLADEFFRATSEEREEDAVPVTCCSNRAAIGERLMADTESSRRRGRSVSRGRADCTVAKGNGISGNNGNSRPRRSVSVSRSRRTGLEGDKTNEFRSTSKNRENSACESRQKPSLRKQTSERHALGRSSSQKDFLQPQDCYSSNSSSLTDDEAQDARSTISVSEKTLREVYNLQKTDQPAGDGGVLRTYEDKRKQARSLAEGLMELEKSEKRKQDLLAALAIEEKHGQKLCGIVRELLSSPKQSVPPAKPSPSTSVSSVTNNHNYSGGNRVKISKCLDEEAEKFFEDFLSNVEDTDYSSFDGERSDAGSTVKQGGPVNNDIQRSVPSPAEMDDVTFPWLRWEASSSSSSSPCKSRTLPQVARRPLLSVKDSSGAVPEGGSSFDMDECLRLQRREDLLLEMWEHRQSAASGSLLLCGGRPFLSSTFV